MPRGDMLRLEPAGDALSVSVEAADKSAAGSGVPSLLCEQADSPARHKMRGIALRIVIDTNRAAINRKKSSAAGKEISFCFALHGAAFTRYIMSHWRDSATIRLISRPESNLKLPCNARSSIVVSSSSIFYESIGFFTEPR